MKSQAELVEESMVWAVGRLLDAVDAGDQARITAAVDLLRMKHAAVQQS